MAFHLVSEASSRTEVLRSLQKGKYPSPQVATLEMSFNRDIFQHSLGQICPTWKEQGNPLKRATSLAVTRIILSYTRYQAQCGDTARMRAASIQNSFASWYKWYLMARGSAVSTPPQTARHDDCW